MIVLSIAVSIILLWRYVMGIEDRLKKRLEWEKWHNEAILEINMDIHQLKEDVSQLKKDVVFHHGYMTIQNAAPYQATFLVDVQREC